MRKGISIAVVGLAMSLGVWFALAAGASPAPGHAPPSVKGKSHAAVSASHANAGGASQAASTSKASASDSAAESGNESEGESNGESGGNETDTHEDPDGQNVDHQCPPSCDTANGETP